MPEWFTAQQLMIRYADDIDWKHVPRDEALRLSGGDVPWTLGGYVIAHELVHLLAPNHGKVFTSFLTVYMPGLGEARVFIDGIRK